MQLIPAVDILDGQVVCLVGGKRGSGQIISDDPAKTAREWQDRGARRLHVVDLNAAFGDGDSLEQIRAIRDAFDEGSIQVGGGIRDEERLGIILDDIKAEIAVIGTRGISDPEWLAVQADERPHRITLAVDAEGEKVVVKGWTEEAGGTLMDYVFNTSDIPLHGYLYTNVAVEGKKQGLDWEPVRKISIAATGEVIISGGIHDINDLMQLKSMGVKGSIVGAALYDNDIKFEDVNDSLR